MYLTSAVNVKKHSHNAVFTERKIHSRVYKVHGVEYGIEICVGVAMVYGCIIVGFSCLPTAKFQARESPTITPK